MATAQQPRRQMSDAQREALERGRAERARKLAEQAALRETEQETLTASPSPILTTSPRNASAALTTYSTSSEADVDLSALEMIFDADDDEETPPVARDTLRRSQSARRAASPVQSPLRSLPPRQAPSTSAKAPAKATKPKDGAHAGAQAADEREARIRYRAQEAAPSLAHLIILATNVLAGNALAPNQELAEDISKPALRILMRHVPALLEMSPDAADGVELFTALALWSDKVTPVIRQARAERRVQRGPVTYQPRQPAGQPSNAGRAGAYYPVPAPDPRATPPNGGAGYGADAASGDRAGGSENGSADTRPWAPGETQVFAELGIGL